MLDRFLDQAETTLPSLLGFIVTIRLGLDDEEVVFLILVILSKLLSTASGSQTIVLVDNSGVVTHDRQLGLQAVVSLVLDNTTEGIAHDSDEHVQEGDLGEEGREREEQVDKTHLWMIIKAIHSELSQ